MLLIDRLNEPPLIIHSRQCIFIEPRTEMSRTVCQSSVQQIANKDSIEGVTVLQVDSNLLERERT